MGKTTFRIIYYIYSGVIMQLTQDQLNIKQAVRQFYHNKESFMTINGSAGTGKTTVLKHLYETEDALNESLELIDPNYEEKTMVFSATTNKAVNLLQSQFMGMGVQARTIHSFLGYRPVNGKLKRTKTTTQIAIEFNNMIIVIDEASMIGDDLFEDLEYIARYSNIKFLFVGDSNQLPPVKQKTVSKVFTEVSTVVRATQVVRQENELLQLADSFRQFVETDSLPVIQVNGTSIQHVDQDTFEKMIIDDMSSDDWNIKDSRVVAYSNKKVQHYNALIKKDITGSAFIKEGEMVINNHYLKGANNTSIPTEAEVYIRKIRPLKAFVDGFCYDISVGIKDTTVWMPLDEEAKKELKKLKREDKLPISFLDTWADLRPMYASTIHKSQGSTFKRIYIDLNSIKSVQYYDPLMFKRLLYVAVSRASEQVIFTGDI